MNESRLSAPRDPAAPGATLRQVVRAPCEHQGILDSLSRAYAVETMPEEFRRLLGRIG